MIAFMRKGRLRLPFFLRMYVGGKPPSPVFPLQRYEEIRIYPNFHELFKIFFIIMSDVLNLC